jgi:hypothetical protein
MIHRFYFKIVYTSQTIYYDIELNSTIASFILNIKNKVRENFNIDNNYAIDIVEAGQFNNINGRDAELAPALEPSNLTLLQKYENNYKQTSFYIRKRIEIQI